MKHINEILAGRQSTLFGEPHEKGSGEWQTWNAVRDDKVDSFRVLQPRRPIVLREPNRVLRIVYPQSHELRLSGAH